ncbi:hypothetical protein DYB35_011939, partial [Aphanomyces astaci]
TSFRAYHEYLKKFPSQYTEETGDKLFYLSFAQVRCSKNTDRYLLRSLGWKHPPSRFRVTGALQNNAEFARNGSTKRKRREFVDEYLAYSRRVKVFNRGMGGTVQALDLDSIEKAMASLKLDKKICNAESRVGRLLPDFYDKLE